MSDTAYDNVTDSNIVRELTVADSPYDHIFDCLPGNKQPSHFNYCGNIALLGKPLVMICGSRRASEYGCELAYQCAESLSGLGIVVVSGWARGIDRAAHSGALDAGGDTIALLPHGINKFFTKQYNSVEFFGDRLLVISHTGRNDGFSVQAAYQRNKYMAAVSSAIIVIEPGDTGGSWYSARQALALNKPLFFLEGSREDFRHRLAKMGAARIRLFDGRPIIEDVAGYTGLSR